MEELEKSLKENKSEISPSTIFAMASISEGVSLELFIKFWFIINCVSI